jgi:hypothetical protein
MNILLIIPMAILGICVIVPFLNFIRGESDPTTKEIILWIVGFVMWIIVGLLVHR